MEKINVILMAAGLGSRLRPITDNVPKPLVKVGEKKLIETVMDAFTMNMDVNFYIVTGYLGKKFECLLEKYNNVSLIKNPDFNIANNISSIFYARDIIRSGACFICESDLLIRDASFLERRPDTSCYYGRFVSGYFDDWGFETDASGFISKVKKGCQDTFAMTGVAYFDENTALLLADCIEKEYKKEKSHGLFWDEIVDKYLDKLLMKVREISGNQIIEIDTVDELNEVREKYGNIVGGE